MFVSHRKGRLNSLAHPSRAHRAAHYTSCSLLEESERPATVGLFVAPPPCKFPKEEKLNLLGLHCTPASHTVPGTQARNQYVLDKWLMVDSPEVGVRTWLLILKLPSLHAHSCHTPLGPWVLIPTNEEVGHLDLRSKPGVLHSWVCLPHRAILHFGNNLKGFPGGSDGKASAYNAGDPGSIPGLGRSPGEGNGNPLQYSCLEILMDGRAC